MSHDDKRYESLGGDVTEGMRQAYALLRSMSPEQRGRVLCWFCDRCYAYVGPGQNMTCDGGHHV